MKLIRTKGRGAQQTAEMLTALERRGGAALDAVAAGGEGDCDECAPAGRQGAARSMRRSSTGSAGAVDLRVTQEEMSAAWEATEPKLREALATAAAQIRGVCCEATAGVVERRGRWMDW